jgi:hypothetical protein
MYNTYDQGFSQHGPTTNVMPIAVFLKKSGSRRLQIPISMVSSMEGG